MRRTLVPIVAAFAFSLGTIFLGLAFVVAPEPASGQRGTPGAEGSPQASPIACPGQPAGRLVAVPNNVTIQLTDEGFDPGTIQTTNNTDLKVTLINTGSRPHAFVLEDFDVRVELDPGERETLSLTPVDLSDAVTHTFRSDLPGDECMRGKLIFYI